jgi:hypothetical protein
MDSQQKAPKSIYDASAGEIAYKNFLVGFSRGLGGFFITILTWVALYYFTIHYVLPQLTGILGEAKGMIQSVEKLQNGTTNLMLPSNIQKSSPTSSDAPAAGIVIPPEMVKQFQQMQQNK